MSGGRLPGPQGTSRGHVTVLVTIYISLSDHITSTRPRGGVTYFGGFTRPRRTGGFTNEGGSLVPVPVAKKGNIYLLHFILTYYQNTISVLHRASAWMKATQQVHAHASLRLGFAAQASPDPALPAIALPQAMQMTNAYRAPMRPHSLGTLPTLQGTPLPLASQGPRQPHARPPLHGRGVPLGGGFTGTCPEGGFSNCGVPLNQIYMVPSLLKKASTKFP